MTYDPRTDIDPRADEYAHRTGQYEPMAGLDEVPKRAEPKRTETISGMVLGTLSYPRAVRFIPPPGRRDFLLIARNAGRSGTDDEFYKDPWVPAHNELHLEAMADNWLRFWRTADPSRELALRYRVTDMEVIVEVTLR